MPVEWNKGKVTMEKGMKGNEENRKEVIEKLKS